MLAKVHMVPPVLVGKCDFVPQRLSLSSDKVWLCKQLGSDVELNSTTAAGRIKEIKTALKHVVRYITSPDWFAV